MKGDQVFGCPQKILSDRGTEFTGRVWGKLMELLGIQQVLTSPYYPQGNGIIEQSHRTVGNMVRAQLGHRNDRDRDWVNVYNIMDIRLPTLCGGRI